MRFTFFGVTFVTTIALAVSGLAIERSVIAAQKRQAIKHILDEVRPAPRGVAPSKEIFLNLKLPAKAPSLVPEVSPKDALRMGDYVFENSAQVIIPPAEHVVKPGQGVVRPHLMILPPPMAVISTGDPGFRTMSLHAGSKPESVPLPLFKPSLTPAKPGLAMESRSKPQIEPQTDNQILKLKDGSLLAIRNTVTWEDVAVKPVWWNKVSIQKHPFGSRVEAAVWWSSDGKKWQRRSSIDPVEFENGRYAVPRPVEDGCPDGCFGGWDRTEAYADPWSGEIYVTMDAAGGPIVDYKSGKQTEVRAENQFLFKSIDGGKTWTEILKFGGWTPIVMTTTPNGRLYLYSCNAQQPALIYSTVNQGINMQFSQAYPVNIPNVLAGSDKLYGSLVYKATNSISRISTDASSKVRLSYPILDSTGVSALAVMEAEIKDDKPEPVVTPLAIVRGKNGASVLASQFVDSDWQSATQKHSNSALLYWMEGTTGDKGVGRVRCMLFEGDKGMSAPADVSAEFSPPVSIGHYMAGGSYVYATRQYFFVHWDQQDGLYGNIVGILQAPGAPATPKAQR